MDESNKINIKKTSKSIKKNISSKHEIDNKKNNKNINTKGISKGTVKKKEKSINVEDLKKVKKFMVNERKRKLKISRIITIFIFLLIIVAGSYLLLNLSTFNLMEVNLSETEKCTKEEVLEKTGIKIGKNIFTQYFTCNKKNASTLPYIESIKIKLVLPNKIDINVVERKGKYFVYNKDTNVFYSLSEDGYILEQVDINNKKKNEILVVGVTFDDEVNLGTKINDIDLSKIEVFKKVEKSFYNKKLKGTITKVSFEKSLTTITINDKLSVIFPNDMELDYKMSFLKGILAKIGEDSVGVIDMTKTNPTYSSF